MFDRLQDKLLSALKKMARSGRLTEADVDAGLREIRLALLEADVNLAVVKDFVARVRPRAVGADVLAALAPVEMLTKIVYDELTEMLGGADYDPRFHFGTAPDVIMCGPAGQRQDDDGGQAGAAASRDRGTGRCSSRPTSTAPRPSSSCGRSRRRRCVAGLHARRGDPVDIARAGRGTRGHPGSRPRDH